MADSKAKVINLQSKSDKEFFLIHGYTGSPTDFNQLPFILHKEFNANVKVLMLKGHGTKDKDLDDVEYQDIMKQIETELKKDIKEGKKIILGGVSLGAILALILASEHKEIYGLFNVCAPYSFKFPFNLPGIRNLWKIKKYWKKKRMPEEKNDREKTFSYSQMHAKGLKVVHDAMNVLGKKVTQIKCPILTIHSLTDPIGHHKSLNQIQNSVKSNVKSDRLLNTKVHNVFFSMNNKITYGEIVDFVKEKDLFRPRREARVAAIIPSYNEGGRIARVLDVVIKSKVLDEIIVVDDGSTDNTGEIVKKYKKVRYLKNKENVGKAGSMDIGVNSTNAEIIFFCDADLIGLKDKIIKKIVDPVKEGNYNMFIGLRKNLMQRTVHLFALNSGERALRREVWEGLPNFFKHNYRIEAGLNYYVRNYFGGFGFKRLDYSQPIKEKKYGFFIGSILRWKMNLDVLLAYFSCLFMGHLIKKEKEKISIKKN